MNSKTFKGKNVLIMGLGVHGGGVAAAEFFARLGANVTVTDLKTREQLQASLRKLSKFPAIKYVLGEHKEVDFRSTDLVIRNPGVPKESKYLKIAKDNGADVQLQEGVFFLLCPSKNIIGVTGTKGKTTTSYLVHEVLKVNGLKAHIGGNMKIPVLEILKDVKENDWVVLELSSWQCEALDDLKISPKIGVITNISQDHLNRYGSYEDYAMSKSSIFRHPGNQIFITQKEGKFTSKFLRKRHKKCLLVDTDDLQIVDERAAQIRKIHSIELIKAKLKGIHNISNIISALAVSEGLNLDFEKSLKALVDFRGVPYRLEEIGKINGVLFVNDTTATAPAATIEAIKTYEASRPVVILGGADKDLDFKELTDFVKSKGIRCVLLSGSATDKILKLGLDRQSVYDNFDKAIESAYQIAHDQNGIVLLSPGAASFGMFQHEFDRGDQFNKVFKRLKKKYEAKDK